MLKVTQRFIGKLLLIPLFVILFIIFFPLFVYEEILHFFVIRKFRHNNAGRSFLICSSRRNWHDFLQNNLIPILPDNFLVVWVGKTGKKNYPKPPKAFRYLPVLGKYPILVVVTRDRLKYQSLHDRLYHSKMSPKKSEETRRTLAAIIADAEKELQRQR